ncbi:MAG: hypothetical protein AAB217_17225 [Chloroflexota bacterium]
MAKLRVVEIRQETPAEAAQRDWFEKQVLASPGNLEEAARLIIGLITGLLGALFGVLAITSEHPPAYLALPAVRYVSAATVVAWLAALLAALVVVTPLRLVTRSARPDDQAGAFDRLLRGKATALYVAVIAFGLGIAGLSGVLVVALLNG